MTQERGGETLKMEQRLGANYWREKFKWVREGKDYEGRMAGNRQNSSGQNDRALNPPEQGWILLR